MKVNDWLIVNRNGIKAVRKSKPALDYDEIAVRVRLEIPDELFERPVIDAKLEIKDVPNIAYNPEIIVNTAELIEQQTGAKINFSIVKKEEDEAKE